MIALISGPRPKLGDVASEIIHAESVKRDYSATGVPKEKLPDDKWTCIMRQKDSAGYVLQLCVLL